MSEHYLSRLFLPQSVALIGATEREGALGRLVFLNMRASNFCGTLYAVNPKHDAVFGEVCYARLGDLPASPDLIVIATPAASVAAILRDAGEAGVHHALILSSGFSEADPEGKVRTETIEEIAKRYRIRLLGPHCVGMMRPAIGLNATFAHAPSKQGSLALVSQSGTVCTAILDWAATTEIGFSSVISLTRFPNSALDVGFGEVLDFLVHDSKTKSILLYIESIHDARGFLSALRAAARVKPVVVLKAGRHAVDNHADSHTDSNTRNMVNSKTTSNDTSATFGHDAGADAVFDAALARSGALRVMTSLQLFAAARLLAEPTLAKSLRGSRLAIITNGVGPGLVAADCAADHGLTLATLSAATLKTLDTSAPPHRSQFNLGGNPVNLIDDAAPTRLGDAIQAVAADAGVDALLVLFCPQIVMTAEAAAEAVIEAAQQAMALHGKPVFTAMLGGASVIGGRARLDAAHIPHFLTPENAVEAFSYLARFRAHQAFLLQSPHATDSLASTLSLAECAKAVASANAIRAMVMAEQRTLLSETEAKQLLAAFGLPVAIGEVAITREAAEATAKRIGFPVVMKIHSPKFGNRMPPRSDIGGVRLNLATTRQVGNAFDEMLEALSDYVAVHPPKKSTAKQLNIAQQAALDVMHKGVLEGAIEGSHEANLEGVEIQPMLKFQHAREVLVGFSRDAVFGPVIAFGAGGAAPEAVRDTALALPPLNAMLAAELISRTRVSHLLAGYRNVSAIDHTALHNVLVRVSTIACQLPWIVEMHLNPVMVHPHGAAVVGARIVIDPTMPLADAAHPQRYQHMAIFPYPVELERELMLKDQSTLKLRAIRPDDAERERAFVAAMSDTSRYYRFLHAISALSDDMLARFTQLDYDREMALIALTDDLETDTNAEMNPKTNNRTDNKTDNNTRSEKIAGVARYHPNPDHETVEFAIAIADTWQGKGLGEQLMKALVSCARDAGYRQIEGSVLPGNMGMLKLAAVMGFTVEPAGDAVNTIKITLAL